MGVQRRCCVPRARAVRCETGSGRDLLRGTCRCRKVDPLCAGGLPEGDSLEAGECGRTVRLSSSFFVFLMLSIFPRLCPRAH